jgi:hypothetical protein
MRWKPLPANPVLSCSILDVDARGVLPVPLERPNARFFAYARAALYQGIKLLGVEPGQNVLMPSLICRAAVVPFNALGIHVRYYPVGTHFEPDLDQAGRLVDKLTRAFVLVHHFGFPQNVEDVRGFCRSHNLWFIEDNAHGFLSCLRETPLGTFGDISIFSLRKTVPVPNGAALLVNNAALIASMDKAGKDCGRPLLARDAGFLLRNLLRNFELLLGKPFVYAVKTGELATFLKQKRGGRQHESENDTLSDFLIPYSLLSKFVFKYLNWEKLKAIRIAAFSYWRDYFKNHQQEASPVFSKLIPGTIPYVFPVTVRDRDVWIEQMAKRGVECFSWPDLPRGAPEHLFSQNLAAIPLHLVPKQA